MELNYSAITGSSIYFKCLKLIETTGKQKAKYILIFFLIVAVAFLAIFIAPVLTPLVILAAIGGTIIALIKLLRRGAKEWQIMQKGLIKFAEQNSFKYQAVPYVQSFKQDSPSTQLTLPFKAKLHGNYGNLKGTYHDLPFEYISTNLELINYKGLSAQPGPETRFLAALVITLPVTLPKLFIDTKRNNIAGFEAKANNIDYLQQYNLEGNFPKFYRVFAQKDDQINVLSILTPDVMDKLLEHKYFDVWLDGNKLVIFALGGTFEYFAAIPLIFPTAKMLLQEIDKINRALSNR